MTTLKNKLISTSKLGAGQNNSGPERITSNCGETLGVSVRTSLMHKPTQRPMLFHTKAAACVENTVHSISWNEILHF